jgi:hypothetical protein
MPSWNQWNLLHAPPAAGVATIRMQLVFSKQIAIGIGTEELRSISKWVDHTLESMYESHHGVKASVLEPTVIESGEYCPKFQTLFPIVLACDRAFVFPSVCLACLNALPYGNMARAPP